MLGLPSTACHDLVENLFKGLNQIFECERRRTQALRSIMNQKDGSNNLIECFANLGANVM